MTANVTSPTAANRTTPMTLGEDVRIGDRDRDQAADRLAAHAAAGRLSVEELEHRLEQVNAAVFSSDLRELEADLPGPRPRRRRATGAIALPLTLALVALVATVLVGHPFFPLFIVTVLASRVLVGRHRVLLRPERSLR
jgi:Domain of unknown function (DUF1707)